MSKRVYIETYGCQMNEHDTERMLRLLEEISYSETKEPKEADLILVNTCSVREKPEHKVYSALGRFKDLKEQKSVRIGVTGCVAQQEGQRLLDRIPHLDLVIGTHAIQAIPELVQKVDAFGERVCEIGSHYDGQYVKAVLPKSVSALGTTRCPRVKAYVTIMQGCDHFCSFCIVPYLRGRERSRPSHEILEEIKCLAQTGVKEVCLLGQNVNGYGKDLKGEVNFPELLGQVNEVEGIERIRFITSHPRDFVEELIQVYSKLSKLCEHLHLPFQSGSNNILKAMHRGYTRESYLEKIDRLRERCPSVGLSADVIVGFPGEEEEDFAQTLDLIQRIRFDDLFSFKYSPRKGTRAAEWKQTVEEKVKQDRLSKLQEIQREVTFQKNQALVGRVEEILVEGQSRRSEKEVTGRTRSNKIVNFEGDFTLEGTLTPVRITKAFPHSLKGKSLGSNTNDSRASMTDHMIEYDRKEIP